MKVRKEIKVRFHNFHIKRGACQEIMGKKFYLVFLAILILSGCEPEEPIPVDPIPPKIETLGASSVTSHSAVLGGKILDSGNKPITRKGICWLQGILNTPEEEQNFWPTVKQNVIESSDANLTFTIPMDDLGPNKTYYVRAFAESEAGLVYGSRIKFTTNFETITDIDGYVYRIWKIGDQTWTIDNFNATRLRDGTPIPNRTEGSYWLPSAPKEPAMCWYNNDRAQYEKNYGALYNWYAASHPLIAPEGWRVPTHEDYLALAQNLGAITYGDNANWHVGGKAKMTGFDFWESPNTGATNESSFSAKAVGGISSFGFEDFGYWAYFLCSSEFFNYANVMRLKHGTAIFIRTVS